MLHVGGSYLHFNTNVGNFEPMEVNIRYMEHLDINLIKTEWIVPFRYNVPNVPQLVKYRPMSTHTSRFASCQTVYLKSVHVMIHTELHLLASAGGRSYALCSQSETLSLPCAECIQCNHATAQAASKNISSSE